MDKATKQAALRKLTLRNPWHFMALGFGSGLAPFMPGTFGTLAALPLVLLMPFLPLFAQLFLILLLTLLGIRICDIASRDMEVHDHSAIVWDEVVGMMITMIAVPLSLTNLLAGFIIFRLFDIVKPWPISVLDKHVHGGFGIMLDDVLAGIFALASMQVLLHFNLLNF